MAALRAVQRPDPMPTDASGHAPAELVVGLRPEGFQTIDYQNLRLSNPAEFAVRVNTRLRTGEMAGAESIAEIL